MTQRRSVITLSEKACEEIRTRAEAHLPYEIGGILLGYRENGAFVVGDVLTVPFAHASQSRYTRDDVAANVALRDNLAGRPDGDPTGYIGEWHSHPQPIGPSSLDVAALRGLVRDARTPMCMVIYRPHNGFHALIGDRTWYRRVRVYATELRR